MKWIIIVTFLIGLLGVVIQMGFVIQSLLNPEFPITQVNKVY